MRHHVQEPPAGPIDGVGRNRGLLVVAVFFATFAVALLHAVSASAAPPAVTIGPVSEVGYTAAHAIGGVDPEGEATEAFFETSTDGTNWEYAAFAGYWEGTSGPQSVAADLAVKPGTTYQVRLTAYNFSEFVNVSSAAPNPEFTTKPVTPPTVALDPITIKTDTTAHFSGHVTPNSPGSLDPAGEAAYLTSWQFHCNPDCPNGLESHVIEAEDGNTAISADVSGLEPNTSYQVTLTATNAGGEGADAPQTFSTDEILSTVHTGVGSSVGSGGYQLEGTVNPHNSAITDCKFEYGSDATYGQSVPCDAVPAAGNKPTFVTASLSGLQVGTNYHFRLSATNGAGPIVSSDAIFTPRDVCPNESIREEQHSTYLPECRAYEQVSNPFKEAFGAKGAVMSLDGSRLFYRSSGNFAQNALGFSNNRYLATRSVDGWTTESLNPPAPQYAVSLEPDAFTSIDLRSSVWTMSRSDQTLDEQEFYRRGPTGVFERVGPLFDQSRLPPSEPGGTPLTRDLHFALANVGDLSRIVFVENVGGNTRDWPLLEYDSLGQSSPRPVGVDNLGSVIGNNCLESPGGAQISSARRSMSQDGRVFFWTSECAPVKRLFARIGHTVMVAVSNSECSRSVSDPAGPCLDSPLRAEFQSAAADGSVVYFTSPNQLVNDDTDETEDLYACDIPAGQPAPSGSFNSCSSLTMVSGAAPGANVQGVVGVSADGTHVYFVARAILAANVGTAGVTAQAGDYNLYLWERDTSHPQGATTFVTKMDPTDGEIWGGPIDVPSQITISGGDLLLLAKGPLVTAGPQADTDGGTTDVYRYDAGAKTMDRVSIDSSGDGGNEVGAAAGITQEFASDANLYPFPPAISEDGKRVAFTTKEALSPFDHNESFDTYLWSEGRVRLLSSGNAGVNDQRPLPAISPSGTDVFFSTTESMAATDTDTSEDVYSVHINGGFSYATASSCQSEAGCRAPAGLTPKAPDTSTNAPSTGNLRPPKQCRKGKVRKKGRCVKRHQKKGKHGKRRHAARQHGGAK